ncbi:MAG: putative bifunctional diguanylate cyclase/phosphodiesterase [Pseudomonadota bacterium]
MIRRTVQPPSDSGEPAQGEDAGTLLRRLRRTALLGALATAIIVATTAVATLYPQLRDQARERLAHEAHLHHATVANFLEQRIRLARQVTSRTAIRRALADYHAGGRDRASLAAFTEDKLADAVQPEEGILGVTRLDAAGREVVAVGEPLPSSLPSVASEGELRLLPPFRRDGRWQLAVDAPIREDGTFLGTDRILFDLQRLQARLEGTGARHEAGTLTLVLATTEGPRALESGEFLAPGTPTAAAAAASQREGRPGLLATNGTVAAHHPLEALPGAVVVTTPASALYAPINRLLGSIVATTVLLLLALTWLLIRAMRPLEERLRYQAEHDPLTGLPNRLLLTRRLQQALRRADDRGGQVAVLFLDLDRFKDLNDSLGHTVGDELLEALAHRLATRLPRADIVARLGGDEFLLVMESPGTHEAPAELAGEAMELLREPFRVGDWNELFMGASIGISLYPDHGRSPGELLTNADAAMFRAKAQGRNTWAFYAQELTEAASERLELEAHLRRALERDEFAVHYQPQWDTATGRVTGAEALARWHHPEQGTISPGRFIPVAEESGLIIPLGERILRSACAFWAEQTRATGERLTLAVNLSARQVALPDLAERIDAILDETGLDPCLLELEFTESVLLEQHRGLLRLMQNLRARGVQFAIDDFGTGYSSLAYLKDLAVDRLKIDRAFIRDLPADESDAEIVAAVIAMAHNLRLTVTAEGVETEGQLAFLGRQGCDQWQGFLGSRPLPNAELETLLSTERHSGAGTAP